MPRTRTQLFDGLKLEVYSALNTFSSTCSVLSNGDFEVNSSGDTIFKYNSTELARLTSAGVLGVGIASSISARIHSVYTSEQLRLGYDLTNYASFTCSSTGILTISPTGAAGVGGILVNGWTVSRTGLNGAGVSILFDLQSDAKTAGDTIQSGVYLQNSSSAKKLYSATRTKIITATAGAEDAEWQVFLISSGSTTQKMTLTQDGNLGLGLTSAISARVHLISTGEIFRIGYDSTNYISNTLAANGSLSTVLAGAKTTTDYVTKFQNTTTSSTGSINKIGAWIDISGNWTGASSIVYGLYSTISSTTQTSYGASINMSGATSESFGIALDIDGSLATNAYGIDIDCYGAATGNFAINIRGGDLSLGSGCRAYFASSVYTNNGLITSSTSGFFYLSSVAGTPSGAASTVSGSVPLLFDSTNNRLYAYNSSWKIIGANLLGIANGGTGNTSFTANGVVYYDSGNTKLANNSSFLYDGTNSALGTTIDSSMRMNLLRSGAETATVYGLSVTNSCTSSTSSIQKVSIASQISGNWSGASSNTKNIAATNTSNAATNYGFYADVSSGTANYAFYSNAGASLFLDTTINGFLKTNSSLITSSTSGFFYLSAVAGTPSGAATTASGLVPMVYDSTGDKLYAYNSSWKQVGGGISSLNGLTGATQTFADTDDTNVTLTITSSGTSHTFAMGWASNLSIARGGTGTTAFGTANGLVRYDSGGSGSLVTGTNFTYDGTNAAIGAAINSAYRFYIDQSGAKTTAIYGQYISNSCTSSTSSIIKYGQYISVSGDWTGTSSEVIGCKLAISLTSEQISGFVVAASGLTTTYGVTAFNGTISSTGTNNYGIYLNVSGGTNNYAIWVNAGLSYFNGSTYIASSLYTNTALGTGSTTGFFYLSSVAGTPSGAASTTSGAVPLLYDSSNNKLYAYNGSWKSVTLT